MKKHNIILVLTFILSFINVMADVVPEDFVPKGLKHERTYDLGYSSKKVESSFAILVYNPDKDERGIVIVNKTRKGKYIKIAENLNCLFGDSAIIEGIDDHTSDQLDVKADCGALIITYSHRQHDFKYNLDIMDNGVQLASFEEYIGGSMNWVSYLMNFGSMEKQSTSAQSMGDDWESIKETYTISFDKGYKNPILKNLLDFRKGLGDLFHYKENLVKTELVKTE